MSSLFQKIALLSVVTLAMGCGLFSEDGDPFDIEFRETVDVSFTIDGDDLCPPNADCSGGGTSPTAVTPPIFDFDTDIDIVELTGSSQLRDVSGRLKSVEIESVDYNYADNTLNTEGPRVVIFVGPLAATGRSSTGVVEVVDLPAAQPMDSTSGNATVDESSRRASSDLFKGLQLSVIPVMQPAEIARDAEYPSGSTDVELTLNLKFVANPTDL